LEVERSTVDLAPDEERFVVEAFDGSGKRCLRPSEVLAEKLRNLVRIALDLLLSEKDEVGFLFFDNRFARARNEIAIELIVCRIDAKRTIGAGGEHLPYSRLRIGWAKRDDDDFAEPLFRVRPVFGQAERGLDGIFIERIGLPLEADRFDFLRRDFD